MLATLRNAAYGFDERQSRSVGRRDGIFLMDRRFRPANAMMSKLFEQFLDMPGSRTEELAAAVGVPLADLLPVWLVSHHIRLLGMLVRKDNADWLVLVDCDRSQ
jgi:hypothetical protein